MNPVHDLLKSLFILAAMVEARDPYTGGHLWRVSQFSRILAENAGLSTKAVARVALGGFLHDLGKIGVAESILNKPDRLAQDEYEVVQTHPEVGARLLTDHPLAGLVRASVLSHHETPDGKGYPYGLAGKAVPLDARIVGICDAFDAMTSTRPYRTGLSIAKALHIIHEHLGHQFDADLGKRFLALEDSGVLEAIVGHSEPGIPIQACPICGPTIVLSRRHRAGSLAYCRRCGAEVEVLREGETFHVKPTGRRRNPARLEPDVDNALIDALVEESGRFIRIGAGRGGFFGRLWDRFSLGYSVPPEDKACKRR